VSWLVHEEWGELQLRDGFDVVLVDRDEWSPLFVVDDDIRQADEHPLIVVQGIRQAVTHRRDDEFADIDTVGGPDLYSDSLAFDFPLHSDLQL
jgi:hypothetical protein